MHCYDALDYKVAEPKYRTGLQCCGVYSSTQGEVLQRSSRVAVLVKEELVVVLFESLLILC